MALITLLLTVLTALILSNVIDDGLPALLWGWIQLPRWLIGAALLTVVAWCIDSESPIQ